jgi:hypothetical protein
VRHVTHFTHKLAWFLGLVVFLPSSDSLLFQSNPFHLARPHLIQPPMRSPVMEEATSSFESMALDEAIRSSKRLRTGEPKLSDAPDDVEPTFIKTSPLPSPPGDSRTKMGTHLNPAAVAFTPSTKDIHQEISDLHARLEGVDAEQRAIRSQLHKFEVHFRINHHKMKARSKPAPKRKLKGVRFRILVHCTAGSSESDTNRGFSVEVAAGESRDLKSLCNVIARTSQGEVRDVFGKTAFLNLEEGTLQLKPYGFVAGSGREVVDLNLSRMTKSREDYDEWFQRSVWSGSKVYEMELRTAIRHIEMENGDTKVDGAMDAEGGT